MAEPAPRYLLDTNIWSAIIRRSNTALVRRFSELTHEQIFLSPVVWGELQLGYYKGDQSAKRKQVIETIEASAQMLTVGSEVSSIYAQLRAELERSGTPIGPNDSWIAAEALHHKLILVTDNTREFARVPELKIENWL